MTEGKNPSSFYGRSYLETEMGCTGGATRMVNNVAFQNTARFVSEFVADSSRMSGNIAPTVLDVGCGRGWVVKNLCDLGVDAFGCEYSRGAIELTVAPTVPAWCDLADPEVGIPHPDDSFDLVICLGVLSHPPAEFADNALQELRRVTKRWIWTNVLVLEPGMPYPPRQEHHRNVQEREYWLRKFRQNGLRISREADELMGRFRYGRANYQFTNMLEKA